MNGAFNGSDAMTLNDEKQRQRLLHDIFEGKLDIARLARRYRVSIAELALWIGREENRRAIERLCVVADVQTQVMLGRYRQVAAAQLIKLATRTDQEDRATLEVARRACVDVLRMELQRTRDFVAAEELLDEESDDVAGVFDGGDTAEGGGETGDGDASPRRESPARMSLRELLYGARRV